MQLNDGPKSLADILKNKKTKKAPAYQWQDLALRVVQELGIPNFKRSAVFKACKDNPRAFIETALNDTKELCQSGAKWKYFFKIIGGKDEKDLDSRQQTADSR